MDSAQYLIPVWAIITGWIVAGGSPGPTNMTIVGTSMSLGRGPGLLVSSGVLVGSATWGIAAALGFSAIMMSNVWVFETVRYAGAAYLLYLAVKSLRSAWQGGSVVPVKPSGRSLFTKGILLHLTNPKPVLAWGSVYAIVLAPGAEWATVWQLFGTLICTSAFVFWGYALLFSWAPVARVYARSRRWFELTFGLLFGAASIKILTLRLT
ncbi:LysE family translocator [Aliisedimentitalea scapharcae]|uniref:LysE family translocator n=1 Tax=Aliisedimentitalea scapharcae TaxID=1524259 RepID=A0ABZ2XUQ9_9RHOB|nr:LysE family translocator [Rhodobacteraceae bacterium M382]